MSNATILFDSVFGYVRREGKHIHQSIGSWDSDQWSHPIGAGCEVVISLEDEVYTLNIRVAGLVNCRKDCNDQLHFTQGSMEGILTTARLLGLDF